MHVERCLAECLLAAGKPEEAVTLLSAPSEEMQGEDGHATLLARALNAQSDAAVARGELESAIALHQRALDIVPSDPSARLAFADRVWEAGGHVQARTLLVAMLRENPAFTAPLERMQARAREADTHAWLLPTLRKLADGDVDSALFWQTLAGVFLEVGERGDAAGAFRRAVALRPEDGGLRIDLAQCLLDAGQFDAAYAAFAEAGERGANAATVYTGMIAALKGAGRLPEARALVAHCMAEGIIIHPAVADLPEE